MMGRLAIALMWLLHWLPFPLLGAMGRAFGLLLWAANRERRRATMTNLRLCFPQRSEAERRRLAQAHFVAFAQTALERNLLWWSSPRRLKRLIQLEGQHHLAELEGRPMMLLAPHFVGLDMGWTRLCLEQDMVTMYSRVKNPAFDAAVLRGRTRFGRQKLLSRQDGLRSIVGAIRAGLPFYYLPDLDYGPRDAVFVPFFGMPAATITAVSRLAKLTGAQVLTVTTRRRANGYTTTIGAPWADFPTADASVDAARMNREIEQALMADGGADLAQYLWSHKRFKTRPAGEKGVY
ncbi:lipid A biosynthesis lauroyl acyltransferase [Denitratisoma sp. agr-D3]